MLVFHYYRMLLLIYYIILAQMVWVTMLISLRRTDVVDDINAYKCTCAHTSTLRARSSWLDFVKQQWKLKLLQFDDIFQLYFGSGFRNNYINCYWHRANVWCSCQFKYCKIISFPSRHEEFWNDCFSPHTVWHLLTVTGTCTRTSHPHAHTYYRLFVCL